MKSKKGSGFSSFFNKFSSVVTRATGSPIAFIVALSVIIIWAVTGPIFKFSDTWQLIINTSTTIITFLMVFVIQQSQNKDTLALQLKLNELIACSKEASNHLIEIEELTPEELQQLRKFYLHLAQLARHDNDIHTSHSLDEANEIHTVKSKKQKV